MLGNKELQLEVGMLFEFDIYIHEKGQFWPRQVNFRDQGEGLQ